jgi:hypothetical protein
MNTDVRWIVAVACLSLFTMSYASDIAKWIERRLKALADRHQSQLRVEWSPRVEAWRRFQQVEVIRKEFPRQKSPVVIRATGSPR